MMLKKNDLKKDKEIGLLSTDSSRLGFANL